MIASQFRQLRDFFRSQDFRHSLLITGGAFAALIVLAFAAGLIFPAVPAQVLTLFSQQMADAGVVSESGSISVPALLWNNLRAMVLSVLYGFIRSSICPPCRWASMPCCWAYSPHTSSTTASLYWPIWGASCPTASLNCRRWSSVWPAASTCAAASTSMSAKTPGA